MKTKMRFGLSALFVAMLLVSMALVPGAMAAQPEDKYNVTIEKAFDHANAHMIDFVTANTSGFEQWKGASINPEPLELYDINGKKLFYLFSIYNNNEMVGRMKLSANKVLGHSVQTFEFDPKPLNVDEAIKQSLEIANEKFPAGDVKSTKMVVYSYPKIGAMTVVADNVTGEEYRIIVDAYTLDMIPDKSPAETESGVWSMYEPISKEEMINNVDKWYNSDNYTKALNTETAAKGLDIHKPLSEEELDILEESQVITSIGSTELDVRLFGQEKDYYCAPATAQMIADYYDVGHSQTHIAREMGTSTIGTTMNGQLAYYTGDLPYCLGKSGSDDDYTCDWTEATGEIDNGRPLKSGIPVHVSGTVGHARACIGYMEFAEIKYLSINDPWPVNEGNHYLENWDLTTHGNYIYVRD
jgi:hypothetical protein